VVVYGYPLGGTELAVTKGIISRVEYAEYQFLTQGLRIQVDAAINPGNSGGPAVVDGKMVGTIFSRLPQADNIGYIIPAEEIELFLKDVGDGHYDGKPVFIDEIQPLVNPALRRKMGLDKAATGVLITKTVARDPSYPLKPGDVLTRIGDQAIDNTGMVQAEGDRRLSFHYLVQRHARDHRLGLVVLRGGRELKVEVPVNPGRDVSLFPYLKGGYPSYLIYGPLVFTEVTDDFIRLIAPISGGGMTLAFQGNPMVTRYGHRPAFEGERIVVVAHPMFTHRLGTGYRDPFLQAVAAVNGIRIRNLRQLAETLRDAAGEYVEITFQGDRVETIVFPRKDALEASEEVLNDNGIRQRCSPDLTSIWERSK
jgi:hypothetical protein